jgi:FtsP/CotA-like multicopper oxidase with cupredoxin domain
MKMQTLLKLSFIFSIQILFATTDTLYLKTSSIQIGTTSIYKTTLRQDTITAPSNAHVLLTPSEELFLTIINLDPISHQLAWHDQVSNYWINPGQQVTLSRVFSSAGAFALFANDFLAQSLGCSYTVLVGSPASQQYIWNLWEMQSSQSIDIGTGVANSITTPYRPDVFTINGLDYPLNMNDTLGNIMAQIGDSIYIAVVNSGHMAHAIHFHGYHVQILQSFLNSQMNNWNKDSIPIQSRDVVLLLLVPDQPGMYPVHDHNLTAVTSSGGYSGGMMTMIQINP